MKFIIDIQSSVPVSSLRVELETDKAGLYQDAFVIDDKGTTFTFHVLEEQTK